MPQGEQYIYLIVVVVHQLRPGGSSSAPHGGTKFKGTAITENTLLSLLESKSKGHFPFQIDTDIKKCVSTSEMPEKYWAFREEARTAIKLTVNFGTPDLFAVRGVTWFGAVGGVLAHVAAFLGKRGGLQFVPVI